MYDASTAALIRSTPELPGLDREALPDALSAAFAKIVSARIALRDAETPPEDIVATISFARRLARTNEALVAISPEREDRRAASFVAATAHQLVHQAETLFGDGPRIAALTPDAVGPDIAAMLLFLIAGASADATEIARSLRLPQEDQMIRELILSLSWLAQGRVGTIADRRRVPRSEMVGGTGIDAERANAALYHRLLEGVRAMASVLLGDPDVEVDRPAVIFQDVMSMAMPDDAVELAGMPSVAIASFPGPFHLAKLLTATGSTLLETAVVNVDPPGGVPAERWRRAMARLARKRPYLWTNHLAAIDEGYLEPGTSSAVGFPTGAGKSTTAQLKIQSTLLMDRKVIFLAPTHALVDQTARDLRNAFPGTSVQGQRVDDLEDGVLPEDLPDILVMTPEACLYSSHVEPESFADVGLLIFDECHLIHPKTDGDRRAIDAMLCLIRFTRVAPEADLVLLSAMMQNTDEISEWLRHLTGRRAIPLDNVWKPTRQLRGCVVYEADRIEELKQRVAAARRTATTKYPPAVLKRQLLSSPFGFFSLKQTWASNKRDDYALLSLLDHEVLLGASDYWSLTPNSGELASHIAAAAARAGLRTLVFSQTIPNAHSIAKKTTLAIGPCSIALTQDEQAFYDLAVEEMGDPTDAYLPVEGGILSAAASTHHGLLLPSERQLVEALYRRKDGLRTLAATPTLAQGMNLPADLVIIAEDSRYDAETSQRDLLDPAALLNAAGRAGRAGESATGIVLVIPGEVVALSETDRTIGKRWTRLRRIFGRSDQCLVLDDPFEAVMDRVHDQVGDVGDLERYVVARLMEAPYGGEGQEASRIDLSRSLAAYRKQKVGDKDWVASRTEAARLLMITSDEGEPAEAQPYRDLASMVGLPEDVLEKLSAALADAPERTASTVSGICDWMFDWLETHPEHLFRLLKSASFEDLFGTDYRRLPSEDAKAEYAVPKVRAALHHWMAGAPLKDVQPTISAKGTATPFSTDARKFVIRLVPDLAHLMGLPARILQMFTPGGSDPSTLEGAAPLLLTHFCVRRGLRDAEMGVYGMHVRASRRSVHLGFEEIERHLDKRAPTETREQLDQRVRAAMDRATIARDLAGPA